MNKYLVNKEDAVLLVVDIQEKLMKSIAERENICKNAVIMLKASQIMGIPVIVTEQYPKGLGSTVDELKKELTNFYWVEKMSFSAYIPEVERILTELNRRTIIAAGVETHICVFQTVRDLAGNGFAVHVLKDAVGSRNPENKENGLHLMLEAGAVISNTETILFDMLKTAKSDDFKKISALVK